LKCRLLAKPAWLAQQTREQWSHFEADEKQTSII